MKIQRMLALIETSFNRVLKLTYTKGEEYTIGDEDRLINFKEQGKDVGVHPTTALFFALDKHWRSIKNYLKEVQAGQTRVLSEPISARVDDAILYLILLKCLGEDLDLPGFDTGSKLEIKFPTLRVLDSNSISSLQDVIRDFGENVIRNNDEEKIRRKLYLHEIPELIESLESGNYLNIEDEMSDVMILMLDLCRIRDIDIGKAILKKMEINMNREWITDENGLTSHIKKTDESDNVLADHLIL